MTLLVKKSNLASSSCLSHDRIFRHKWKSLYIRGTMLINCNIARPKCKLENREFLGKIHKVTPNQFHPTWNTWLIDLGNTRFFVSNGIRYWIGLWMLPSLFNRFMIIEKWNHHSFIIVGKFASAKRMEAKISVLWFVTANRKCDGCNELSSRGDTLVKINLFLEMHT